MAATDIEPLDEETKVFIKITVQALKYHIKKAKNIHVEGLLLNALANLEPLTSEE